MSIVLGNKDISEIYYIDGDGIEYQVQAAYKGEDEVFTYGSVIDLGTAKDFDIAAIYDDYQNLTEDDFVVVNFKLYWSDRAHCPGWTYDPPRDPGDCHGTSDHISISSRFQKEYNAETGHLRITYGLLSGDHGVPLWVYLIPDFNRAVERGKIIRLDYVKFSDNTWGYDMHNVLSDSELSKITIDNFVFRKLDNQSDAVGCWSYNCPVAINWDFKQYDPETGIVRAFFNCNRSGNHCPYEYGGTTGKESECYFIPRRFMPKK